MDAPLRAGVLGGGFMAAVHSRAARSAGAVLAGVASSSPAKGERAAAELGFERAYPDARALIEDESIDVVHVCTPNATHAELALAAIEAGKHMVCEKPLAATVQEAQALADAASSARVVATVPFAYRFHPMVREARARVAAGETGRLVTVRGSYLQDWLLGASDDDWRVDPAVGGRSRAFGDIGSHLVDLLEFVTGERIGSLAAITSTVHAERGGRPVETEDVAGAIVRLEGGAVGTLLVSQVTAGHRNELVLEVSGLEESLRFEQELPETLWVGRRGSAVLVPRDASILAPDAARLSIVPSGHPMGYQDAFTAFARDTYAAVAGNEVAGLPTFDDGLRAALITEAVLDAAETGAWVTVPAADDRTEVAAGTTRRRTP
ncbi:Gfo/Idh/MocA family protein [Rathayibacter tanaceti]|uniref:Gfo/Idh/MocA family oxidoreductase n=2 Tax=Rathayibacter tanaceti TaxID=1671680 RepID=A0A162G116_9MICO|nr:Gfo/Idh/MocA family oxidoreductase [Rathayibacter tanaceti]KZX22570.1 Glucose-6-phosphate 3-dehydrogenase [Rathayibacter tanaceti]QHC54755.1 Gfo/Idh/MocA family oxidoreductase [Rathayibacter tanaceti]TCO37426.1 putative dehydrogenase [Rathayibacter tanaceti]